MKIESKPLLAALGRLSSITSGKQMLPLLSNVLIHGTGSQVILTASDQNQWQTEILAAEGDAMQPVCLNMEHLKSAIGGESVTLERTGEQVIVRHGKSVMRLGTVSAKEFPAMPDTRLTGLGVSCPDLARAISQTAFCCISAKAARPMLEGVHIVGTAKELLAESADGLNGAQYRDAIMCSEFELLIPHQMALTAVWHLEQPESSISASASAVHVKHANGSYWCKQVDAKYPNAASIFTGERQEIGELPVMRLVEIMERCVRITDQGAAPGADITTSPDGLRVVSQWIAADLDETIDGNFQPSTSRVNCNSMVKCLRAIPTERVLLSDGANGRGIVMTSGPLTIASMKMQRQ
jgi:DNA polymerase III sliding clamp (beta) subunit (PCNA family)